MDKAEAKDILDGYRLLLHEETDLRHAFDLAIEVLSEPQITLCKDCVWAERCTQSVSHWDEEEDGEIVGAGALTACSWGEVKDKIEALDNAESATTTDCISRKQAINALCKECMHGGYDTCSTDCTEVAVLHNLPPVTPPKRVVAEVKVDTEEVVKRTKEEYQLGQGYGRLIDADKLLQDLFNVDEEEWTTPEIRAILEHAPTIITPTERTGKWVADEKNQGGFTPGGNSVKSCSLCGWIYGAHMIVPDYNYCPNCGAKMGGDTE